MYHTSQWFVIFFLLNINFKCISKTNKIQLNIDYSTYYLILLAVEPFELYFVLINIIKRILLCIFRFILISFYEVLINILNNYSLRVFNKNI